MTAKIKTYLDQFSQAPQGTIIGISLVLLTWLAAALVVAGLVIWSGEKSGQAWVDPQGTELPECKFRGINKTIVRWLPHRTASVRIVRFVGDKFPMPA